MSGSTLLDHPDGPRELSVGRTTDPRRASHARVPSLSSNGFALSVDFRPEPGPVVANVYSQSGDCLQSDKDNPEYEYAAGDLGLSEHFGGGRLMRFGAGIARLEAAPWIPHEPIRPRRYAEGLTERPRLRARGALLLVQRLGSPSGRTLKSHLNPFLTEVQMRGPPHHARASSKLQ